MRWRKQHHVYADAWRYFKGYAFERATLRGIYEAKFRKADKLSCSCVSLCGC